MKRLFATITTCFLMAVCFGKSYKINGVMYELTGSEAKVVAKNTSSGKLTIPQTVKYKNKSYTVTAIGENAFKGCKALKSVVIPKTVTEIGSSAFLDCKALASVNIPDGITTICEKTFGHTAITSVVIPSSVAKVEDDAFLECPKLTSVTLANSTMRLTPYAFNGCSIKELIFADGCTTVFRTYISTITSAKVSDTVTSISDCAFWDCTSLQTVLLPPTLTVIGNNAFNGCHSLVDICIPESLTDLGSEAFFGCSSLGKITIPASTTKLGERVFSGCTSLAEITVAEENAGYASIEGVLFSKDKTNLIAYPNGKATNYIIPSTVKSIAPESFAECTGLQEITIPANVKNIGKRAFEGCTALAKVNNMASSPQAITSDTFSNHSELHVLKGKKKSYGNLEGWNSFTIVDDLKKK